MPPLTRARRRAEVAQAVDGVGHPDLLARIFERLPLSEQCFTVSQLSRGWRRWAAPKHRALNWHSLLSPRVPVCVGDRLGWASEIQLPLWCVREAWASLTSVQRAVAAVKASMNGEVAALEWACEQGQVWRAACNSIFEAAAARGHLPVLQWLREQQPPCPWDSSACTAAAGTGNLGLLQWLRQQDPPCPWDAMTCTVAVCLDHRAVLEWLREQQPPCPWGAMVCCSPLSYSPGTGELTASCGATEPANPLRPGKKLTPVKVAFKPQFCAGNQVIQANKQLVCGNGGAAGVLPPGPYAGSCTGISWDGPTLTATCNNVKTQVSLYYPSCAPGTDVYSTNGVLRCSQLASGMPAGSWAQTCGAANVPTAVSQDLYAYCQNGNGRVVFTYNWVAGCPKGFSNSYGYLTRA